MPESKDISTEEGRREILAAWERAVKHPIPPTSTSWTWQPARKIWEHSTAKIDASAAVGPGSIFGPGVRVGANARVESSATLHPGVSIGDGSYIGRGAIIGQYAHLLRHVDIRDNVTVGSSTIVGDHTRVNDGASIGPRTRVGNSVAIGADASIGELCILGDGCSVGGRARLGTSVRVHDECHVADDAAFDESPTTILGGYYPAYHAGPRMLGVGCQIHPVDWWREHGRDVGFDHDLDDFEIAEYARHLEYLTAHDLIVFPPQPPPETAS